MTMEEQLQREIKKNKTLLQSNLFLMQENQTLTTALTKLRNCVFPNQHDEDQVVQADDADELIDQIASLFTKTQNEVSSMNQILTAHYESTMKDKNNIGSESNNAERWKQLYKNESEETYKLSQKLNEIQNNMKALEIGMEADRQEMQNILRDYLKLFKQVNSYNYLANEAGPVQNIAVKEKQNKKAAKNITERSASSRSKSKNRNTSQSTHKKNVPNHCVLAMEEVAMFPNFISYLENLQRQMSVLMGQIKTSREQIVSKESVIRMYRLKERERLLERLTD